MLSYKGALMKIKASYYLLLMFPLLVNASNIDYVFVEKCGDGVSIEELDKNLRQEIIKKYTKENYRLIDVTYVDKYCQSLTAWLQIEK